MPLSLATRRTLGSALVFFAHTSVGQASPADDFVDQPLAPPALSGYLELQTNALPFGDRCALG
jgi:hypothetical protein